MALPELHKFERDLKNNPPKGSNAPPRTVRAKDLDENFVKVTLIESDIDPPPYRVKYTDDGTMLTDLQAIPEGERDGDILYWDQSAEQWSVFPAINSEIIHVLTIENGSLKWIATQDC